MNIKTHPKGSSTWTPISSMPQSTAEIPITTGVVHTPQLPYSANGKSVSQVNKNLAVCLETHKVEWMCSPSPNFKHSKLMEGTTVTVEHERREEMMQFTKASPLTGILRLAWCS